jgi:hypothetical protein
MITQKGAIGIVLILGLACAMGQAEAREKPWKSKYSGSYVSTEIDTNGDEIKGAVGTFAGKGSEGSFTEQAIAEWSFDGETNCNNGNPGWQYTFVPGSGHFVVRYANGDLLWGQVLSGISCVDPATGIASFSVAFSFTRGTGKFAEVEGSGTCAGTAKHLFVHPPLELTGHYFGEESGNCQGTIDLP